MKFKLSNIRAEIEVLQSIENKANGVPSCGSRFDIELQQWINDENLQGASKIRDIETDGVDFSYEMVCDYSDSDRLTDGEKDTWNQAFSSATDRLSDPSNWFAVEE